MNPLSKYVFKVGQLDRKDWWDSGVGRLDMIAALIYLALSLGPLFIYALKGVGREWLECPGWPRFGLLFYGSAIVTASPWCWLWLEGSAFFDWSAKKYGVDEASLPLDPASRVAAIKAADTKLKEERDKFKLHSDCARGLWASVIALYAGALLKFS